MELRTRRSAEWARCRVSRMRTKNLVWCRR
uniref:Uncharacterized protein n=1 Tax=Human herpesvirus 2 TaxID=10310 RepID=A0A481TAK8_HHV2|nr:hypothetical protein [Human alphaherpesvirus 2]QBH78360.1 hypothetical protein [Human alphaherpesvirus 2]